MAEIIDYKRGSRMLLGSGYNLLERTVKPSPLESVTTTSEFYGESVADLKLVETASELHDFLKVGLEGGYDSLVFRASMKSEFVMESQINQYSLFVVVRSTYVKGVDIAVRPKLSSTALDLIQKGQLNTFRNSFGDYYISSMTRGGELYGLIRIDTHSESQRSQLKTELSAGGIGWSARGNLESRISSKVSSRSIHIRVKVNGISNYRQPNTVSDLIKLAEEFPSRVEAKSTPVKVELAPVSEFPEYGQAVLEFDSDTRYALISLSSHYIEYKMLLNNIAFMLSSAGANRFDFDRVSKTKVRQQSTKVERKLRDIETLSEQLIQKRIKPNDTRIQRFTDAYQFKSTLTLPNPIEQYQPSTMRVYPLRSHTKGDREMKGHRPKIYITATLRSPSDRRTLKVGVHVKMKEDRKDWTTFEDNRSATVVDLRNSGLKIVSFRPTRGDLYHQAGKNDHEWHWYSGTNLIKRAHCRSDVKGKESGKIGADKIEFNSVKVVIAPLQPSKPPKKMTITTFKTQNKNLVKYWVHPPASRLKLKAAPLVIGRPRVPTVRRRIPLHSTSAPKRREAATGR